MGLWDTVKRNNIHIMGILEGEVKEKGTEKISKTTCNQRIYILFPCTQYIHQIRPYATQEMSQ